MKRRRRGVTIEAVLMCAASVVLCVSAVRAIGTERMTALREQAECLLVGEFPVRQAVEAFGGREETAEEAVAAFRPVERVSVQRYEPQLPEFGAQVLAGAGADFPREIDDTRYWIELACPKPVEGVLTSSFGVRADPISGEESVHCGLDIAADAGTPIRAVESGLVCETGNNSYGNYVVIDHENGLKTLYAHCSTLLIEQYDRVEAGDIIGEVGMTGRATGNHLHLELWRAGKLLDPAAYVQL